MIKTLLNEDAVSVSELSRQMKQCVEGNFGRVRVRGEIGRVSRPGSGHIYFDLKDEKAVLSAVIWKGQATLSAHKPEQGLEAICEGRLTTYSGQSRYQLIVESLEPAGVGALMALVEARRKKLAAQGLFDAARKKPLPFLPTRIGVITSPTGAVIRDILHRLEARFQLPVLVWPVVVQGERCGDEVAAAIRGFNALSAELRPELIIVARGGGSVEDLQGFNEEAPIVAASESVIPLISAIGHETDHTLLDLAADARAATPTAAAEMAVPVRRDLQLQLTDLAQRQTRACQARLAGNQETLAENSQRLRKSVDFINMLQQRIDDLTRTLPLALKERVGVPREKLARLKITLLIKNLLRDQTLALQNSCRLLEAVSYQNILQRGFALVRDDDNRPIGRARDTKIGQWLKVEFADSQQIHVRRLQRSDKAEAPMPPKTKQGGLFDD